MTYHLSLDGIVYGTKYPTLAAAQTEADQRRVLTGKQWHVVDGQPQCEGCKSFLDVTSFRRCIWCGYDRRVAL